MYALSNIFLSLADFVHVGCMHVKMASTPTEAYIPAMDPRAKSSRSLPRRT